MTAKKALPPVAPPEAAAPSQMVKSKNLSVRLRAYRWWFIGAASLLCLSVVGGSFTAGWIVASRAIPASASHVEAETVEIPILDPMGTEQLMPDVRGMSKNDALQVLADAGIPVAHVTVTTQPTAGTSGLIVEQTPAFGVISPPAVTIVVAAPAAVPDLVGADVSDASVQLSLLGAAVTRTDRYDPDQPVGTVLDVIPSAGSTLPETVAMTVNVAPSSLGLQDLSSDGPCSAGSVTLRGTDYPAGVVCRSHKEPIPNTWALNGTVDRIVGTVGIPNDALTGSTATMKILVDGTEIASFDLDWGVPQEFDFRISGSLKLEVVVTGAGTNVDVALVGVLLQGEPSAINTIRRP